MKSLIERLEKRALFSVSAYPLIPNDAEVIADNQHLTDDKTQLTADTASFRTLIGNDKTALQTTVTQDLSAIKADQAAVKADANNPTLLAPAQTTLEDAMIKLSGDTASLKTKMTVDSDNQKATLAMDNLAVRTDQGYLKTDTQAAEVAFTIGVKRIAGDIAAIEAHGSASTAIIPTLEADLTAAARGQAKPAASAILSFASALTTALSSGGLAAPQESTLAQDLVDVVNSGGVPAEQTQGVVTAAQALLAAGGASAGNAESAVVALEGMDVP